jgi:hypothetical protein
VRDAANLTLQAQLQTSSTVALVQLVGVASSTNAASQQTCGTKEASTKVEVQLQN